MKERRDSTRAVALLLLLMLTLTAPFIRAGYITDDFVHLTRARQISLRTAVLTADTFGFYRPTQQVSYWLESRIWPASNGRLERLDNVALQLLVAALVFAAAQRILGGARPAFIAALMFVLAPKTNTIAVTWISARCELLMTVFALTAVIAWMNWGGSRGWRWGAVTAISYAFAILSKENAVLLPLVLPVVPIAGTPMRKRLRAAAALLAIGVVILAARLWTGALTPLSAGQYTMATPIRGWVRNAANYFGRTLPAPATVLVASLAALFMRAKSFQAGGTNPDGRALSAILIFGIVWFLAFIAPVLPVMPRSEIRAYATAFGFCCAAAWVVTALETRYGARQAVNVALLICTVGFGGYQIARGLAAADTMRFSSAFVTAMRDSALVGERHGVVQIAPATPAVHSLLQDSINGYLAFVARDIYGRSDIDAQIVEFVTARGTLVCHYNENRVAFEER